MQSHLEMKQPVVAALMKSLQADQIMLKQATNYLTEAYKIQGFCMTLMEIVDDSSINETIKLAALIQLKNVVKKCWRAKSFEIDSNQKQHIKKIILIAMIRCSQSYRLIKLYKEIICTIVGYQYTKWLPVDFILTKIRADQDLVVVMHVLVAITTSFQFSITEQERKWFFTFLQKVLPDLNLLRQRNSSSELIYLMIKFIWKSVHYEINDQIKKLIIDWMDLIALIVGLQNPQFDNKICEPQTKNTPEFFYFHTKKWATRILLRFIQKHAKSSFTNKSQKNKEFSNFWYSSFGQKFVQTLIYQFSVPTIKKTRYFQFKCIQALASEKPNQIQQFAKVFQEEILLKFLMLKPEDEELAQSSPLQFLSKQTEPSISYTNLKRAATDVWVAFAELGSQDEKKNSPYKPGIYFYQSMKYLKQKLQGTNLIQKQMAMYLICQLRSPITKCKEIKNQLPQWIEKYIIPEFSNEVMFLRARAVDIFFDYGYIQNFSFEVIKKATEGIYQCLTNDHYSLVRIKAANAFNCILRQKDAKELVRPLLQNILTIYLQLLEKYDLQSLVNSLQSIIQNFSNQIGPFAVDLTKYLTKLFIKMFQKDAELCENDNYDGEAELAAAGCLKTLTQLIDSPISQESIVALEKEIVQLCEFIFTCDSIDYIEDVLILLNSYLHKLETITPPIWFYYQVIVYNIVGIPKQLWDHIPNLPISQKQKQILNTIKNSQNIELMIQSMPVLRNFIRKGSNTIINNSDAFKTNLLQLLFYLVNEIYKKGPSDFTGEMEMTCASALLIYLLENNKSNLPQQIYILVLTIVKYNIIKAKSKALKILNSQLQGLLLWINPSLTLKFIEKQKFAEQFIKQLTKYDSKYEEEHERQRVILGLSSVMKFSEKPYFVLTEFPDLFKTLVKLIKKNAEERISQFQLEEIKNRANEEDCDQDENFDNLDAEEEDEDQDYAEFWEQYDDNYQSPLMLVDQIQFFESSVQQVQSQQKEFYDELIKIVSPADLAHLDEIIQKAKNYLYAKNSENPSK